MNNLIEIELKYEAGHVKPKDFRKKVLRYLKNRYPKAKVTEKTIEGAVDTFYEVAGTPIRYRRHLGASSAELTIKARHKSDTTISRDEIDLFVKNDSKAISAFMKSLGGKELFSLSKDYLLFEVKNKEIDLDIVLYTAYNDFLTKKFIEVEVGKKSKLTTEEALVLVGWLGKDISSLFKLKKPLNSSLFEMFNQCFKEGYGSEL